MTFGAQPFERQAGRRARIFLVVDHENAPTIQPLAAARQCTAGRRLLRRGFFNEGSRIVTSVPWPGPSLATVTVPAWASTSCLDQREADTQSRMPASMSLFLLPEHLEDEWQEFRCDALSTIANVNHAAIVFSA